MFDVLSGLKCDDFEQNTFKNHPTREFQTLRYERDVLGKIYETVEMRMISDFMLYIGIVRVLET